MLTDPAKDSPPAQEPATNRSICGDSSGQKAPVAASASATVLMGLSVFRSGCYRLGNGPKPPTSTQRNGTRPPPPGLLPRSGRQPLRRSAPGCQHQRHGNQGQGPRDGIDLNSRSVGLGCRLTCQSLRARRQGTHTSMPSPAGYQSRQPAGRWGRPRPRTRVCLSRRVFLKCLGHGPHSACLRCPPTCSEQGNDGVHPGYFPRPALSTLRWKTIPAWPPSRAPARLPAATTTRAMRPPVVRFP
jgi:hypothetical protein